MIAIPIRWCPVHQGIADVDADERCDFARFDGAPAGACDLRPCYIAGDLDAANTVALALDLVDAQAARRRFRAGVERASGGAS